MLLAMVSLVAFQIRFWRQYNKPVRKTHWWPHLVDTLLLLSGAALAYLAQFNPLTNHWLGLKIICLVLYIGLGIWAMKTKGRVALGAYVLSTLAAIEVLILATQKHPWPF